MIHTTTLAYSSADSELGKRLKHDLAKQGVPLAEVLPTNTQAAILVFIHSPAANADSALQAKIIKALEQGLHVVPVLASEAPLPQIINNLQPINFSGKKQPIEALIQRLEQLSAPDAPRPMTTLTPRIRKSNQRVGLILGFITLVMFVAGVYLVGVIGVEFPRQEYAEQETARVEVRNTIIAPTIDPFLPRTTQDAEVFYLTVTALPTRVQEFAAETATSFVVGTKTPEPTWTPTTQP